MKTLLGRRTSRQLSRRDRQTAQRKRPLLIFSIKSNNHLRFIQHRMESIESCKSLSNTDLTELSIKSRGNLNETKEACRETCKLNR